MLYTIIRSVVAGLVELKDTAGRSHGNLKPSNVLISSRGDVAVAGAVANRPGPRRRRRQDRRGGRPPGAGRADLPAGHRPLVRRDGHVARGAVARLEPAGRQRGQALASAVQRPARPRRRGPPVEPRRGRAAAAAARPPPPAPHPPRRPRRRLGAAVHRRRGSVDAGRAGPGGPPGDLRRQEPLGRPAGGGTGRLARALLRIEADPDLRVVVQELASARLEQFDRPADSRRFSLASILPAIINLKEFPQTQERSRPSAAPSAAARPAVAPPVAGDGIPGAIRRLGLDSAGVPSRRARRRRTARLVRPRRRNRAAAQARAGGGPRPRPRRRGVETAPGPQRRTGRDAATRC